jgi:plastocyanin
MIRYGSKTGLQISIILIVMGVVFAANAVSKVGKAQSSSHSAHFQLINIKNMTYSPKTLTIAPGDTVEWFNPENIPHMVNSDTGAELQSPLFNQGTNYQHLFNKAGKYTYHCAVHPTMLGTIIVK